MGYPDIKKGEASLSFFYVGPLAIVLPCALSGFHGYC